MNLRLECKDLNILLKKFGHEERILERKRGKQEGISQQALTIKLFLKERLQVKGKHKINKTSPLITAPIEEKRIEWSKERSN